jgi:hypothetical protein
MAHESFEDEETAHLLNEHFISIKVDREERPDVDAVYMEAVQMMAGSGGWPLSVFLTPDLEPFFGGTYFPPEPRFGRPSFREVLVRIMQIWQEDGPALRQSALALTRALAGRQQQMTNVRGEPDKGLFAHAVRDLQKDYDNVWGGFGFAPKFPAAGALELLLRTAQRSGNRSAGEMVLHTLERMAMGGIYDHLGGGFHRYSIDREWRVPHFEKMLYDNALLSEVYLHAWQWSGRARFKQVVTQTLDYVLREMTAPGGGFYSSQDADSDGGEGLYYLWTPREIREAAPEYAELFMQVYPVTEAGNFEGRNILYYTRPQVEWAEALNLSRDTLEAHLAGVRRALLARRQHRPIPAKDTKIQASWNGLMISSLARASRVLGRASYERAAVRAADYVLTRMRTRGMLWHTRARADHRSGVPGYLDDYACMANALMDLYETTFEPRWLNEAVKLVDEMLEHFGGNEGLLYLAVPGVHGTLPVRQKPVYDHVMPSGNAAAALALLRLAAFSGTVSYAERAQAVFEEVTPLMRRAPRAFTHMLASVDFYLYTPREIAIVGNPSDTGTAALLEAVYEHWAGNQVVALIPADAVGDRSFSEAVPLLRNRSMQNGRATAYVCRGFACRQPVNDPDALRRQLEEE